MGFSQGAELVHLLIRGQESGIFNWKCLSKIRFCIIASGNYYDWKQTNNTKPIIIPSLHLVSPQDFIYTKSLLNTTQYLNPVILKHHYGHRIPKFGVDEKKIVVNFIKSQEKQNINKGILINSSL